MAVRASMADLLTRLRRLIGDSAGVSQVWDDQSLQDYLDARRKLIRYLPLVPEVSINPGGTVEYCSFRAPAPEDTDAIAWLGATAWPVTSWPLVGPAEAVPGLGDWESDAALYANDYSALVPTVSDLIQGRWTFATSQIPPVFVSGQTYDLYAAAADVLEGWAAQVKLAYGFTSAGQTFNRQQQHQMLLALAEKYRQRARPISASLVRNDVTGY